MESVGTLSRNVIRVIPHSECKTKGEVSVENGKSCWDCYRHFVLSSRLSVKPETPTGTGWISQRDIYMLPAQEAHQHTHRHTYSHKEKCLHNNHIHLALIGYELIHVHRYLIILCGYIMALSYQKNEQLIKVN